MAAAGARLRRSIRADTRFHLAHVLEAACLDRLGDLQGAAAAVRQARRCRTQLSLEEVERTHGKRIRGSLAALWEP